MRSLRPEEAELWAKVAATIRPLPHKITIPPRHGEGDQRTKPKVKSDGGGAPHLRPVQPGPPPPSAARPAPLPVTARNTLDGTWEKRLRSGSIEPDRSLDLHGMNLDTAWHAIDRALDEAILRGDRVILLITGRERSGESPLRRGRIRAAVHDWLSASRHAQDIAAVRPAHPRHGGGGSLYLILRRRRSPR